jgi:HAD superfamily hydrolase (TIGR01509 family)
MGAGTGCVVFDFGGVLSLPLDTARAAVMAALCNLDPDPFIVEYHRERQELDRGTIGRDRYWSRILSAGGVAPGALLLERLGREDTAAWTRINPQVHAWARQLRAGGVRTAILSNMPRYILDIMETEGQFRWISDFRPAVFSCNVNLVKPDPEIYRLCLEKVGLPANRCLFLDDHMPNVQAAEAEGLPSLFFSSPAQTAREISLKTHLEVSGLLEDVIYR